MKLRFIWVCRWTRDAYSSKKEDSCGAKSTNAYASKDAAAKAGERHQCRGEADIHIFDIIEKRFV